MRKRYVVRLTDEEKSELTDMTKRGKTGARKVRRAHTLLLADEGRTDREIAENLHIGVSTVERTRRRFVEGGPENALNEPSEARHRTSSERQAGGDSDCRGVCRPAGGTGQVDNAASGGSHRRTRCR